MSGDVGIVKWDGFGQGSGSLATRPVAEGPYTGEILNEMEMAPGRGQPLNEGYTDADPYTERATIAGASKSAPAPSDGGGSEGEMHGPAIPSVSAHHKRWSNDTNVKIDQKMGTLTGRDAYTDQMGHRSGFGYTQMSGGVTRGWATKNVPVTETVRGETRGPLTRMVDKKLAPGREARDERRKTYEAEMAETGAEAQPGLSSRTR